MYQARHFANLKSEPEKPGPTYNTAIFPDIAKTFTSSITNGDVTFPTNTWTVKFFERISRVLLRPHLLEGVDSTITSTQLGRCRNEQTALCFRESEKQPDKCFENKEI